MQKTVLAAALAAASMPALSAESVTPSNEELYEIIQAQQEEIDRLVGARKNVSEGQTTIGGYGEVHYNDLDSGSKIDFHRFVLFFNHAFNDKIRFFSELELEHSLAGDGKPGEVELEQAYVEYDLSNNTRLKGGLFLVPVGLLNETHEPPTFYGVERNPIESAIIPSTWWEAGAAVSGNLGESGLSYDVGLHSGLAVGDNFSIRSGRQKVAEAVAEDLAVSGRIKYTGIAGLELAATVLHQSDITQGLVAGAGAATLLETHAVWNSGPLTLTALYANWSLDGAAPEALEKDVQDGFYVEGSWRFNEQFGVFARHNVWDVGGIGDTEVSQANVGVNYWPHRNVVVKFDVQDQGKAGDNDGFNLGLGYQF
ncbi:MAG: OprO/OprP family phosphate-selective porin [Proteobacteria bacterium]|nr:OprO/OprP family phosphate-selective porin [Pseudomonadota bacterium]